MVMHIPLRCISGGIDNMVPAPLPLPYYKKHLIAEETRVLPHYAKK